ncbi:MAG: glycosyltransferase, partial [Hyphomicrobiales bacterium]
LVVLGTVLPFSEAILPLLDAFNTDPLVGTAQPRFANPVSDAICPLGRGTAGAGPVAWTARLAMAKLPDVSLTAELLSACMLLRCEIVAAVALERDVSTAVGAIALQLCKARRRGFRSAVVNRAVVVLPPCGDSKAIDASGYSGLAAVAYPPVPAADAGTLLQRYPDHARALAETERQPQCRWESLFSAAHPPHGTPRRLLLDCRGMGPMHNGTSQYILGLLDGLVSLDSAWRIEVQSRAPAAAFHELPIRYPQFRHFHGAPEGAYAAALMPHQPWAMPTVADLHRSALDIVFNMLDTIAWDVIYAADERVESTWQFVARYASGLAYISTFTKDRVRFRFPVAQSVNEEVIYLSLAAEEHTRPAFRGAPEAGHVLLFGNAYDHKDIAPTLQLLQDAFPLQDLIVLGGTPSSSPHLKVIASGQATDDDIHRLIATARAVVYPSYYEGFGLPVVESLAYGRPVLVRKSALWTEIAAHSRLPGALIEFDDPLSLVESLGRVLARLPTPPLPSATALGAQAGAHNWRDCAAQMIHLVEDCLARSTFERWRDRDQVLRWAGL